MSKAEGKVLYSERVIKDVLDIAQVANTDDYLSRVQSTVNSGKTFFNGPLRLWKDGPHLYIGFNGRRLYAKNLEGYMKELNMDGTPEARRVVLNLREDNKWVRE